MNENVIDRPELQPPMQRAFYNTLTAALWTFYVYLLLPLLALLAWYFGYNAVYEEMVMRRGWEALVKLMGFYGAIVLAMGFTQVGWALVNWMRFAGKRDRRRGRERVVDIEFAEPMFLTDTVDFPVWQNAKRLVVRYHETMPKIISVEAT
jgi:poly-beta-1,6-N-acetyl-D-glucosamine biosynthesis protein PgaD